MNPETTMPSVNNLSSNLFKKERVPDNYFAKQTIYENKNCKHRTPDGFCNRSNRQCAATILKLYTHN
jgi:hypothetical protein